MDICMEPDIWKTAPAAVVHGSTTQEPPPVVCPTNVTLPELLQAAGTRLPQEKEQLLVRQ